MKISNGVKLGTKELRKLKDDEGRRLLKKVKRFPIYLILEDILDTYNVGGFFRLAEALAVKKVYLCGGTQMPPNPRIIKASVGNCKLVPWEYKKNVSVVIKELKKLKKIKIIAVEQSPQSVDYKKFAYKFPLAFIFGNESFGIKPKTLKLADAIVEIPLYGLNKSLNAMVAAGIVLYWGLENARSKKSAIIKK